LTTNEANALLCRVFVCMNNRIFGGFSSNESDRFYFTATPRLVPGFGHCSQPHILKLNDWSTVTQATTEDGWAKKPLRGLKPLQVKPVKNYTDWGSPMWQAWWKEHVTGHSDVYTENVRQLPYEVTADTLSNLPRALIWHYLAYPIKTAKDLETILVPPDINRDLFKEDMLIGDKPVELIVAQKPDLIRALQKFYPCARISDPATDEMESVDDFSLELIDGRIKKVDAELLIRPNPLIPLGVYCQYNLIPIKLFANSVMVACSDPGAVQCSSVIPPISPRPEFEKANEDDIDALLVRIMRLRADPNYRVGPSPE